MDPNIPLNISNVVDTNLDAMMIDSGAHWHVHQGYSKRREMEEIKSNAK